MKRMHGWTLLGLAGIALGASLIAQTVRGQPDGKQGGVLPLPIIEMGTEFPAKPIAGPAKGPAVPLPMIRSGSLPGPSFPGNAQQPFLPLITTQSSPQLFQKSGAAASAQTPKEPTHAPDEMRPDKQQPSVSLEWVGPPAARINQPMPCQLLVRNTSNAAVHNVVVRQKLPQGVTCKASDPQALNEANELVWNLGTLPPDQARRIDLHLVAQMRGTLNCQATVTFTGAVSHQVQVREPQLAIKMRAPEKVIVDEPVIFLFAVSNPGDGVAESVKVKVLLPDGLDYKGTKMAEVEVGNLAPRDIRTMQLECQAKGSGMQKLLVVATADGGITANDTTRLEVLVPKLDVTMSGPKVRYVDRPARYVAKVSNPGSAPATNVELHELIPAGFKFNQADHGGQYQETTRTVSWALGDLQPGQNREIVIDVIPVTAGEHRLVAQARSARGLKSEADARTIVEGLPALLIELANTENPIEVGAETAYQLRVVNTGTKTETGIEIACMLPDQLEFVDKGAKCNTALRYRIEGRQVTFEPLPRLAPKEDVIYSIQVRAIAAGDVRFRARIKSDGLREPVLREESTRIYSDDSLARPQTNKTPITPPSVPNPLLPSPTMPSVTTPSDPLPSPALPTVTTPSVPSPALPSVSTPTLPLPSPAFPSVTMPSVPNPAPTPNTSPLPGLPALPGPAPAPSSVPNPLGGPATMPTPIPRP